MRDEPTLYELLGVQPSASTQEIKSAFRQQVMHNHPDQGGNPVLFRMLEGAYEVLISPTRRAEYDSWLNNGEGTPPHGVDLEEARTGDAYGDRMILIDHGDEADYGAAEKNWWQKLTDDRSVPWKKLLIGATVVWVLFAVITGSGVIPGVSGWTVIWLGFWLLLAWVFGSFVLRLLGWVTGIFAFADAYLNDVSALVTASRLAFAFAIWLCGQWFYTWRKGRWHSVVAHQLLTKLPWRMRPDRRWDTS